MNGTRVFINDYDKFTRLTTYTTPPNNRAIIFKMTEQGRIIKIRAGPNAL